MAQALDTDRRQHLRDGILELLGDITYGVLRKHGVDGSASDDRDGSRSRSNRNNLAG